MALLLLVAYCTAILLASLAGGWIPIFVRLTHAGMQVAISFVAGVMLGVGMLHMLPRAAGEVGLDGLNRIVLWLLAGFLVMFFVERFFCYHHHELPEDEKSDGQTSHSEDRAGGAAHPAHELSWGGAAVGLTLHSVLAGVALAASVDTELRAGWTTLGAGFGTFLVIFLHKPLDAMTLGTLMAAGEWSRVSRHVVNALFALAIPLGVVLFYAGVAGFSGIRTATVAYALAFSAGTFLCIALSDLLPELKFHRHDRIKLSAALLLGLALSWGIGYLEHGGHHQETVRKHKLDHLMAAEAAQPRLCHTQGTRAALPLFRRRGKG